MPERSKSPLIPLVVAAVAVVALVATLAASWAPGGDVAPTPADSPAGDSRAQGDSQNKAPDDTWERLVRREPQDPMARGDVDAPVVMIAYSEFQCPFCGKFARDTEPTLVDKYVEDGTLRIEWRDFPYLGPESDLAAHAGRAAAAQDSFWTFSEAMYADQLPPNSGNLDEDYVLGIAAELGLDVDQFREDMSSAATRRSVEKDFTEGQAIGVTGTPAFLVNGVPVIGAQPTEIFEDTIEQAAEEAAS